MTESDGKFAVDLLRDARAALINSRVEPDEATWNLLDEIDEFLAELDAPFTQDVDPGDETDEPGWGHGI